MGEMEISASWFIKGLSMLSGIAFVNGSLLLGWGGIGFYNVGYLRTVAILLSIEVITARLLEGTGVGVKTIARQSWLGLAGILWLIMNVIMAWSAQRRYLSLPGDSVFIPWLGVTLFALGLALRNWAALTLGDFFSLNVTIFERHELIISGPYRFCRHPAYFGSLLQIIGLTLAFRAVVGLVFMFIFIPIVFWRIRDEESLLVETFHRDYSEYQRNVPMLFPRVRYSFPGNS
jgi:protein-S-isoprenylcysteine O-methyltransferase Ste14